MTFKDYFSDHSFDYRRHRPRYPAGLFGYLSGLVSNHTRARDCATGNGQAASMLADHFDHVIATHASAEQIANARRRPRITYAVSVAEKSHIGSRSMDLIVVAQALHWLDLDRFYSEVRCVLKRDNEQLNGLWRCEWGESGISPFLS